MKIVITGSNGLVGQKLVHQCLKEVGVEVFGISLSGNQLGPLPCYHHFAMDVCKSSEWEDLIGKIRPDVVVNLAAVSSPDQCMDDPAFCRRLNVDFVIQLGEACQRNGIRLIQVSTDFVFDGSSLDYSEKDQPKPLNSYGQSKWDAEKWIVAHSQDWSIVRTVLVYGYNSYLPRQNFPLRVVEQLIRHQPFRVNNDQIRKPTLAEDLAWGLFQIIMKGENGIFHLAGTEPVSVFDFALATARRFGLKEDLLIPVSSAELREKAVRPLLSGINISRAREILGFQPCSLQQGLNRLYHQIMGCQA
jgi:dTDP-4-dehydrorhamnose reductase